jgi:hypothetical protein
VDWSKVDWQQRNCDIARKHGVSQQRVSQVRLARTRPRPVVDNQLTRMAAVRVWMASNGALYEYLPFRLFVSAIRAAFPHVTFDKARRYWVTSGLRRIHWVRSRYGPLLMDWDIPGDILGELWGEPNCAMLRSPYGLGPPKWRLRRGRGPVGDREYDQKVRAQKDLAGVYGTLMAREDWAALAGLLHQHATTSKLQVVLRARSRGGRPRSR